MAQTIAELLIKVGLDVTGADQAERELQDVDGAADRLADSGSQKLGGFSKSAGVAFAAVGAAALAAGAAIVRTGKQIFSFVDNTTQRLDAIAKGSASLGVTTDEFQRLGFAAERSGADAETLGRGIRFLNKNLQDQPTAFVDVIDRLGISVQDFDTLGATEKLGLLGDSLNEIQDPTERATLAAKLLGEESGPRLASLLAEGTDGLNALAGAATGVIPDESIEAGVSFQDSLTDLRGVANRLAGILAGELAPRIESVIDEIKSFINENETLISQDLPQLFDLLVDVIGPLVRQVAELAQELAFLNREVRKYIDESDDASDSTKTLTAIFKALVAPISSAAEAVDKLLARLDEVAKRVPALQGAVDALNRVTGRDPNVTATRGLGTVGAGAAGASIVAQSRAQAALAAAEAATAEARERSNAAQLANLASSLGAVTRLNRRTADAAAGRRRGGRGGGGRGAAASGGGLGPGGLRGFFLDPIGGLQTPEQSLRDTINQAIQSGTIPNGARLLDAAGPQLKPEVAVAITNNTVTINQEIDGAQSPLDVADAVANKIRQVFDSELSVAAQSLQTNVLR